MDDKTSAIDPVGRPSDPARTRAPGEPAPEAGHANEARRKLIDELIQTGVPAVAAAQAGTHGGRWLASLYIVIPLLAVSLLFGLRETTGSKENASADGGRPVTGTAGGPNEELAVGAENISFDTDTLTLKNRSPNGHSFRESRRPEHSTQRRHLRELRCPRPHLPR